MRESNSVDFLYLNRDNGWLDFQSEGLELRSDGALQLDSASGITSGALWSGVIRLGADKLNWHRLKLDAESQPPNAHLQCFLYTSDDQGDAPAVDPSRDTPFADPRWRPSPLDVLDIFIGGDAARCLWVGVHFWSDGSVTPVVHQMRVEFDHETYIRHLPAIYSSNKQSRNLLVRFLSLFETFFSEMEEKINDLPALFDPAAAPEEFLTWLAGWLALDLDEDWEEEHKREAISSAFEVYGWRGTPEGLRRALRLFAGVHARIEEPILDAAWWAMPDAVTSGSGLGDDCSSMAQEPRATPENSVLGFTTMLLPAHAQGAVVGTTATLDQSHLITKEEFGAPLFTDTAHQFSVQVYHSQVNCAEKLDEVHDLIDREKPAQTMYHLCVIKPLMRVGFQSRIGIDSIVSGGLPDLILDEPAMLGLDTVISDPDRDNTGGAIGRNTRVGIKTILTRSHDEEGE